MSRTRALLFFLPLLGITLAAAHPMIGDGRSAPGDGPARAFSAPDSVLHAVENRLTGAVPPGVEVTGVRLSNLDWKVNWVHWETPRRRSGEEKLLVGALQTLHYSGPSGPGSPNQYLEFELEQIERQEWSFKTVRTESLDINVVVNVKYPLGGVGSITVDTEVHSHVSTTEESYRSQTTTKRWALMNHLEVGPGQTGHSRLTVHKVPWEVPWNATVCATGDYVFTLKAGNPAALSSAVTGIRHLDGSLTCRAPGGNPVASIEVTCVGTTFELVPWGDRDFVVPGVMQVDFGVQATVCSEVVPLGEPADRCTVQ